MTRPRGGYIGFNRVPTVEAASGIWTLRESEAAKRAGTWPLSLLAIGSLAAWYDASYAESITLSGSTVSQWNDRSGLGRHLVQSSASQRPAYQTNILNGSPVVTFDGSNDIMTVNASAIGVTNVTLFAVMRFVSASGEDIPLALGAQAQGKQIRAMYRANGGESLGFATWGNDVSSSTVSTDTGGGHRVFSTRQNGTAVTIRGNGAGTAYTLGNSPLQVNDNTLSVGGLGATTYFTNCSVAEMIVFYADIGAETTSAVEQYLGAKWGIAVA